MTTEFRGWEDSRSIVGTGIYVDTGARGPFAGFQKGVRGHVGIKDSQEDKNSSVSFVGCSGHSFQNSLH